MNGIRLQIKRVLGGLLIASLCLSALTWLAGQWSKGRLRQQNPPPGALVDVGSYRMHLHCTGEGSPTVVLEAGINDFYVTWARVQPEIAESTRVCSYDRAGLGWSEASPRPRTNEVMVKELHTLLTNAGIEGPYILVGHSFGGINMRLFARAYPDEIAGMVLVDSAHEQQASRLPFLKNETDALVRQFRGLSTMNALGLIALAPGMIPNPGVDDEAYRQYQAVLATTGYFNGAIAESTVFYAGASAPKIGGLGDLPLIVLSHGLPTMSVGLPAKEQDRFEEEWAAMQRELVGLSSNGKQIIATNSGHYIQMDQPGLVGEAILELVRASR